jgi:hypothetical protein
VTLPTDFFERTVEDIFIAYAFSYIGEALEAVEGAPLDVEGIVIQPYHSGRIVSARDAMILYRELMEGQHIPILFTSQVRHREQDFEYGSRLLDLRHKAEIKRVRRNVDAGRWLLWDTSLYADNSLIVQTPIRELAFKPPIEVATNLLSGESQGEPVGAVSIPAPKVLGRMFRHLLEDL